MKAEVFCIRDSRDGDGSLCPGWYWWPERPVCPADKEPEGPFETEEEARESAREAEEASKVQTITCDGFEVSLFRGDDGRMVVQILTHDAAEEDTHQPYAVPKLRLVVNDSAEELTPSGVWSPEDRS